MSVRCEECKYENLPQHSFCGMCGAKLPSRRRVEREREEPQAFSRPSLLGLAETDPTETERVEYLLEDESGGEHRRGLLALLILLVVIAGVGWHWRGEMRAWVAQAGKNPNVAQTDSNPAPAATAPPSATTAPNSPAVQPAPSNDSAAQNVTPSAPSAGTPDQTATPTSQSPVSDATKREPEPPEERVPVAKKPALKPAATKMEYPAAAANESAEAMEAQGEDYLYGHGVRADCGLASKTLLAAAAQSSAKAQTVLGTMYATGHCVPRDVPVAYRWFARASHQDPRNMRLQRDMEVLWAQMTPEERELATRMGR